MNVEERVTGHLTTGRVYFFIALLKAAVLEVRIVFGFLKQDPMPIHFIYSQIHAADHENHTYFTLECHLEGEIQGVTGGRSISVPLEFGLQDDILGQSKCDFRDQRHGFD